MRKELQDPRVRKAQLLAYEARLTEMVEKAYPMGTVRQRTDGRFYKKTPQGWVNIPDPKSKKDFQPILNSPMNESSTLIAKRFEEIHRLEVQDG